jgi:hypothetical protein
MTLRKFLFFSAILAWYGHDGLRAQCQQSVSFTNSGTSTSYDNRSRGCYNWRFTYSSTGFSALSIQVEGAPCGIYGWFDQAL